MQEEMVNSSTTEKGELDRIRFNLFSWIDFEDRQVLVAGEDSELYCKLLSESGVKALAAASPDTQSIEKESIDVIILLGSEAGKCSDYVNLLKQDGELILAVNNKLGIHRWSGKKNTVRGYFAESVESAGDDRTSSEKTATFSGKEIENYLTEAGMSISDTYYPIPDMLYPRMIYRRGHEPQEGFFEVPTPDYKESRISFFDETEFMDTAGEAGIAGEFANSFIVVAGKNLPADEKSLSRKLLYARFNSERLSKWRTDTYIYKIGKCIDVVKKASCKDAMEHLVKIERNNQLLKESGCNIRPADVRNVNDELHFEYIEGKSLSSIVGEMKGSLTELAARITELLQPVFSDKVFNLDMIPSNIIRSPEGELVMIDYEWVFSKEEAKEAGFEIDDKFVRFRAMSYLFKDNQKKCFAGIMYDQFMKAMGFSAEDIEKYSEQEDIFQQYVYGRDWSGMVTRGLMKDVTQIGDLEDVLSDKLRHIGALEASNAKLKTLVKVMAALGVAAAVIIVLLIIF